MKPSLFPRLNVTGLGSVLTAIGPLGSNVKCWSEAAPCELYSAFDVLIFSDIWIPQVSPFVFFFFFSLFIFFGVVSHRLCNIMLFLDVSGSAVISQSHRYSSISSRYCHHLFMRARRKYLCYSARAVKDSAIPECMMKTDIFHFLFDWRWETESCPSDKFTGTTSPMWIIFSGIDHSRGVQTSRDVHHIIDSGQCWEDKACYFSTLL